MCVKLSLGDLNPDYCPSYPTSTYTCKVIIASKVCSDHLTQLIPSKRVNKLMRHIAHHLTYWKKQSKFKEPFQTYKIPHFVTKVKTEVLLVLLHTNKRSSIRREYGFCKSLSLQWVEKKRWKCNLQPY